MTPTQPHPPRGEGVGRDDTRNRSDPSRVSHGSISTGDVNGCTARECECSAAGGDDVAGAVAGVAYAVAGGEGDQVHGDVPRPAEGARCRGTHPARPVPTGVDRGGDGGWRAGVGVDARGRETARARCSPGSQYTRCSTRRRWAANRRSRLSR